MSEFNKLHEHLRECVEKECTDDAYLVCMTENGDEFSLMEYSLGLSVNAKKEHEQLRQDSETLKSIGEFVSKKLDYLHSNGVRDYNLEEICKMLKEK